jgi:hypothetical protein
MTLFYPNCCAYSSFRFDMIPLSDLAWPIEFCLFSTAVTYIASIITGNASQVDRVWTFLPTIYTTYFALLPLFPQQKLAILIPYVPESLHSVAKEYNPRALLMFGLIFTWMCR